MSGYRRNYSRGRRTGSGGSRWMALRYAGTCKVCERHIPAGESAYWDAEHRTVTCRAEACCEADGLGQYEPSWDGSRQVFKLNSGDAAAHRYGFRVGVGYVRDPGE